MSDVLYLFMVFDHQTREFVPLGIVTADIKNKIEKNKPWTNGKFLKYHVNELDWDTIGDYKFNIKKEDML